MSEEDPKEFAIQNKAKELGIHLLSLEDTQQQVEQKLLEGWTLLNQTCPISHYPLLKDNSTGETWSIRCGLRVSQDQSGQPQPPRACSNKVTTEPMQASHDTIGDQSQRVAEKLLLGWTMLDETCPITQSCPLMLDPETNRKWSAGINDFIDATAGSTPSSEVLPDDSPDGGELLKPLSGTVAASDKDIGSVRKGLVTRSDKEQQNSITEKLIAGWTMLEEVCPITGRCPLLKSPDGRLWSAAVNAFVDKEGNPVSSPISKSALSGSNTVAAADDRTVQSSHAADVARNLSSGLADHRDVKEIELVKQTIKSKMEECRQALEHLQLTADGGVGRLQVARELMQTIVQCLTTLEKLG